MFFHRTALNKKEKIENLQGEIAYAQVYAKRTNNVRRELAEYGTYEGIFVNKHCKKLFEDNLESSLNIVEKRLEDKNEELIKLRSNK